MLKKAFKEHLFISLLFKRYIKYTGHDYKLISKIETLISQFINLKMQLFGQLTDHFSLHYDL